MFTARNDRTPQPTAPPDRSTTLALEFLDVLFRDYPNANFRVRLWDGTIWSRGAIARFTLALKHPGALRNMFESPDELTLGEAYVLGDFDIEGDIGAAFEMGDYLLSRMSGWAKRIQCAALLHKLPKMEHPATYSREPHARGSVHSKRRDRKAISYHYDLPPEFYSLFLDTRMLYSCAYFRRPADSLDEAQQQKLDHICRKLRLRSGDRFLDIGCGWGALVVHAATHYGAQCLGVTLSERQAEYARHWIEEAGLHGHCRVELCDYRDIDDRTHFDKIASVGMFEHVGERMLPTYFRRAHQLLRPGGLFLNHGIAQSELHPRNGESFIDHYVFPDGDLVPIHVTLRTAELSGFEVRDVESLREHYAMTLERWTTRLERRVEEARRLTDDVTYRIWRLYMAGCAHAFHTGRLNLYQSLLSKSGDGHASLPLTREDLYAQN